MVHPPRATRPLQDGSVSLSRRRRRSECGCRDSLGRELAFVHPLTVSALPLQHSCSPNLFVQNVFVDTHDLRFPWVAFFASK